MPQTKSWTWADYLSSYRFWALALYLLLLTLPSVFIFNQYALSWLQIHQDLSYQKLAEITSISTYLSIVFMFPLAWLSARVGKKYIFYIISLGCLIGGAVFLLSDHLFIVVFGLFLAKLCTATLLLTISAFIAGGRTNAEGFIIAFGGLYCLKSVGQLFFTPFAFYYINHLVDLNAVVLYILLAVPVIIGTLLLLPVKSVLFNEAPPERQSTTLKPEPRSAIGVFFLTLLVPFYALYWLYRTHAEIRFYADSRNLLTAKASVWVTLSLPFILPIIALSLSEHCNHLAEQKGTAKLGSNWLIILFAFFLPVISFAMLQSRLNRLALLNQQ